MNDKKKRVIGILVGDIRSEPAARTKYSLLFTSLSRHVKLVEAHDASLKGFDRWLNAAQVFHPDIKRWKERYYQNAPAFSLRSRQTSRYLQSFPGDVDLVFQVGVLLDSGWGNLSLPVLIYTDYTACLSAQKPESGRSPFSRRQREHLIALERQAFSRSAHICTRSELVRRSIVDDYGIVPEKVTVVGGGVNFALPLQVKKIKKADSLISLFIGKDFWRKGGDLLLKAFARTRKSYPNARLLMVTTGPIPIHLPQVGVEVIEPTWDRLVIESLYSQADIFVLPSRLETWGDVILEAMAYAIPCVGVDDDAIPEIIKHGETGIIVPPENIEQLATAMEALYANESLRIKYGIAGRKQIEKSFTWDQVIMRMEPIINNL